VELEAGRQQIGRRPGNVFRTSLQARRCRGAVVQEGRGLGLGVVAYDGAIMMARVQVALPPEEHRRARKRAAELGISFAEYVRRLVAQDLGGAQSTTATDGLFDLGDSGGSDIAEQKDRYLRDSFASAR
jgi:hypothetical protein